MYRECQQIGPEEILVRVGYEGVCATDVEIADGNLGYYKTGAASYPIVPGHEFAGTVVASGALVSNVRVGDRVVVECIQSCGRCASCMRENWIACQARTEIGVIGRDGGYQEEMVTPARFAHRIPANLSLKKACLCEPLAVVLKGLRRLLRACPTNGATQVAVVGAGPIGHLSARLLNQQGRKVVAFDRDPRRCFELTRAGIESCDRPGDLHSFDAVIEATGDPDALDWILSTSWAGTTILLLGLPYARRAFSFESIVGYDKTIVGSVGSTASDFAAALELLPALDTGTMCTPVLPLADFQQAWELSRNRAHLKILLAVDPTQA